MGSARRCHRDVPRRLQFGRIRRIDHSPVLQPLKTALESTLASVTAELKPEVEQVKTDFAAVPTATAGLTTDNLREKAPAIATALRGLDTALSSLTSTLSQNCPTS